MNNFLKFIFQCMLYYILVHLIYGYFINVSCSDCVASMIEWQWIIHFKRCARKRSWPNLRYYLHTFLQGLKKTSKNLSQDSWNSSRALNPSLLNTSHKCYCLSRLFSLPILPQYIVKTRRRIFMSAMDFSFLFLLTLLFSTLISSCTN